MKFMRDKQGRLYAVDNGIVIGEIFSTGDVVSPDKKGKKKKGEKKDGSHKDQK